MRVNNFRFSTTNFYLNFKFCFGQPILLCKIHTLLVFSYQYLTSYHIYFSIFIQTSYQAKLLGKWRTIFLLLGWGYRPALETFRRKLSKILHEMCHFSESSESGFWNWQYSIHNKKCCVYNSFRSWVEGRSRLQGIHWEIFFSRSLALVMLLYFYIMK